MLNGAFRIAKMCAISGAVGARPSSAAVLPVAHS